MYFYNRIYTGEEAERKTKENASGDISPFAKNMKLLQQLVGMQIKNRVKKFCGEQFF